MSFNIFRQEGFFARYAKFQLPGKSLETPVYFPAISSSGNDKTINYIKFLIEIKHPTMLISAYDFFHIYESKPSLVTKINNYPNNGNFLFVDSGGYEQKWNSDKAWEFEVYKDTLSKINADIYTSLDLMEPKVKRDASFDMIKNSYTIKPTSQFMPIFDGSTPTPLIKNIETFLTKFSSQYSLKFLTVREKDCGSTLTEKASTIFKIRKIIDNSKGNHILHVLGCGHPLNIALYSYYGADSFDSRDWYQKTLDSEHLLLRDFAHLELLNCKCKTCKSPKSKKLDPYSLTVTHNITGYLDFTKKIQELIKKNQLKNFLTSNGINNKIMEKIQS